jgi:hypothetical protein
MEHVNLKQLVFNKVFPQICEKLGIDYEKIEGGVIDELKLETSFPSNPSEGELCGPFVFLGGKWSLITSGA